MPPFCDFHETEPHRLGAGCGKVLPVNRQISSVVLCVGRAWAGRFVACPMFWFRMNCFRTSVKLAITMKKVTIGATEAMPFEEVNPGISSVGPQYYQSILPRGDINSSSIVQMYHVLFRRLHVLQLASLLGCFVAVNGHWGSRTVLQMHPYNRDFGYILQVYEHLFGPRGLE